MNSLQIIREISHTGKVWNQGSTTTKKATMDTADILRKIRM